MGRLGRRRFPAGTYVYVGSALNGLATRLGHHLRRLKVPRWHVDYLRRQTRVVAVYVIADPRRRECEVARFFTMLAGAQVPAKGFGASDCRCPSHLIWLPAPPAPAQLPAGMVSWPLLGHDGR